MLAQNLVRYLIFFCLGAWMELAMDLFEACLIDVCVDLRVARLACPSIS